MPKSSWRRLNFEQRVAAVGAALLIVSTFGPFSFVELAIVLTGAAVLPCSSGGRTASGSTCHSGTAQ